MVMKSLVDVVQPLASFGTFINGLFGLREREGESVCVCVYLHTYLHLVYSFFCSI